MHWQHWTDYKISLCVRVCVMCVVCVSLSVCHTIQQIATFHRCSPNFPPTESPGNNGYPLFWWKSEIFLSAKPEVEFIVTIVHVENICNVRYLEYSEIYNVGHDGGPMHCFDWHYEVWPWMIWNCLLVLVQ